MKLIDEKGRLFGLINIFDLLILLALFIVMAAVGFKLAEKSAANKVETQTKTWIATVKCPSVPDKFADILMEDPRIFYETDGFVNAKVIGVKEEDAVVLIAGPGGEVIEGHDPNLKDAYVQIEVEDNAGDAAIKVGRYAVCVGGKLTVKTIYAASVDGLVIDLYEK